MYNRRLPPEEFKRTALAKVGPAPKAAPGHDTFEQKTEAERKEFRDWVDKKNAAVKEDSENYFKNSPMWNKEREMAEEFEVFYHGEWMTNVPRFPAPGQPRLDGGHDLFRMPIHPIEYRGLKAQLKFIQDQPNLLGNVGSPFARPNPDPLPVMMDEDRFTSVWEKTREGKPSATKEQIEAIPFLKMKQCVKGGKKCWESDPWKPYVLPP